MGYDENFLEGLQVMLPLPGKKVASQAYNNANYILHSRYSILFNQVRGFASCSAHNIDGKALRSSQLSDRKFKADPKITPRKLLVENKRGYYKNDWDRGHLARRKSMSWGNNDDDIITAEQESDYYSNIAPQHENLHDDAWGKIEDWMLDKTVLGKKRACVFTGPVFSEDDPEYKYQNEDSILIPAGFWKVIIVPDNDDVKSASFLVWQRDYNSDKPLDFAPVLEQVRLTTLEVLTGLSFHDLPRKDVLYFDANRRRNQANMRRGRTRNIRGRFQNAISRTKSRSSTVVFSPEDIIF